MQTKILLQHPEFQEIIEEVITKSQQLLRPPDQVIIDDVDLQRILKCSKRKTAEMREERLITYYKPSGKIFYKLSDVYAFLEKNKVPAIGEKLKL